ncbi:hypothetical protein COV19_03230 [Candidatus Woesearchaeota archaeon CG10_big_fil_rev_8_21_14_0_10_44_13]|nr:MAG: hypothetical protein COV19_03230 [Candidatus Woesearchaeota archaeon CG10_big_fil_rev_8_21_14_0_10_44_13]
MADKKTRKGKRDSVIVLCAHSDDQVFGVGGTLAKYAKEGKRIIIIVFSYGEKSHPWLKRKITVKMRVQESHDASEIIGAEKTIFYGVEEGKFKDMIISRMIDQKLRNIFSKYRPSRIFTHSSDDPLPDHRELNQFVLEFCNIIDYKGDVLSFDVWNPFKLGERNLPRIVVDISDTFKLKISALKCFRSQWMSMASLLWSVYYRAIKNGFANHCRYAEVFYKIR